MCSGSKFPLIQLVWTVIFSLGFTGLATAYMTPIDPGVPPASVDGGTVTLPDGNTAQVIDRMRVWFAR